MSDEIVQQGGLSATLDKSGKINPTGKVALDPTQTEAILSNMQRYLDERESPMSKLMGGINKAYATTYGPSAVVAFDQQKNQEDKQAMDYRTQMAGYRAAQAQAENDTRFMSGITGGGSGATSVGGVGGVGGADLGPEAWARIKAARNPTEQRAIYDEELKTLSSARSKGRFEAAGNKSEKFWINGAWQDMTPNMFANLPPQIKQKIEMDTYAKLGYIPGQQNAPAANAPAANAPAANAPAATTGGTMTPVAAIRTIESGNNPNVGSSSKGAVGAMQVLPSTAKDPGFGVQPVQNNTPEEMERLGRDYYGAMQKRYKDDITAAIAYNWGPGNTDKWLAAGADPAKLPAETRNYITKFQSLVGSKPAEVAVPKAPEVNEWNDNTKMLPGHAASTVNEWEDNKKMLPGQVAPSINEWDNNTKMLPGHAAAAAPAAAVTPVTAAPAAPVPTAVSVPAPTSLTQAPAQVAPAAAKPSAVPPPVGTAPIATNANAVSNIPEFNEPRPSSVKRFDNSTQAEKADLDWEKRRDAHITAALKFNEQVGKESAGSYADAEKSFVTNTDQKELSLRETNTNQLDAWMKRHGENPRILEILSKPEFANAVADALHQGITTPIGGVNIPGIARLVQAGMPGLQKEDVVALKELDSIMGPRIFQIVKQSKGSSSDKDWAAFTQIAGNANTGYDFLHKAIKYDRVSLKADKADRNLYNSTLKPGQPSDYRGFAADPRRTQIYDEYNNEVKNIAAMKHEKQKLPPKPANMPKDQKAQWSPSTQSYWIGNTEYKVK